MEKSERVISLLTFCLWNSAAHIQGSSSHLKHQDRLPQASVTNRITPSSQVILDRQVDKTPRHGEMLCLPVPGLLLSHSVLGDYPSWLQTSRLSFQGKYSPLHLLTFFTSSSSTDDWVVFVSWRITLQWTWSLIQLFEMVILICLAHVPRIKNCMVILFLVFWVASGLHSTMALPICIPTQYGFSLHPKKCFLSTLWQLSVLALC